MPPPQRRRFLFNGVGHHFALCTMFAGSPAEGVEVRSEHKAFPLAEYDSRPE